MSVCHRVPAWAEVAGWGEVQAVGTAVRQLVTGGRIASFRAGHGSAYVPGPTGTSACPRCLHDLAGLARQIHDHRGEGVALY